METLLIYILKSSICLSLFYVAYKILLAKETFFALNRAVLLIGVALALGLPFITIELETTPTILSQFENKMNIYPIFVAENTPTELENVVPNIPLENETYTTENQLTYRENIDYSISWITILSIIYVLGLVANSVLLLLSYLRMKSLIKKGQKIEMNKRTYYVVDENIVPFSWGKDIVLSKDEEDVETILKHELAHIERLHLLDILFSEVVLLFHWFNPVAWTIKQELKNLHEYQVDEDVVKSGIDATKYQLLILKKAVGASSYALANSFNHSKIKKRITMMLKQKSKNWNKLKTLLFIPLALTAVYAFSCTEVNSASKSIENLAETKTEELVDQVPSSKYHPPLLDEKLVQMASGYGIRLHSGTGLKRFHAGLDYTAPEGTPIFAMYDGEVIEATFEKSGYGNIVKLSHGNNVETWYAHNKENLVKKGDKVKAGQNIALLGNTGRSTSPRLHLETRKNGKPFNPSWLVNSLGEGLAVNEITDEYVKRMETGPFKICIDPGHGGKDPGAIRNEIKEKDITLAISTKLFEKLKEDKQFEVLLTRNDDTFTSLETRSKIATQFNTDLFISIHINASASDVTSSSGIKSYVSTEGTKALESIGISDNILSELKDLTQLETANSTQKANFYLLKDNNYPSLSLDIGYINNPADLEYISNPKNQEQIAEAMYRAIKKNVALK